MHKWFASLRKQMCRRQRQRDQPGGLPIARVVMGNGHGTAACVPCPMYTAKAVWPGYGYRVWCVTVTHTAPGPS